MKTLVILCVLVGLCLAVPHHKSKAHNVPAPDQVHHQRAHKHQATHVEEQLKAMKPGPKAAEVCTTPECQISANEFIANMDATADPCEDFNQFACGTYYDTHIPITGSQGAFYDTGDQVDAELTLIMTSDPTPGSAQPVVDANVHYKSCVDTDTMDALSYEPLWSHLNVDGQNGWPLVMDTYDDATFDIYKSLVKIQSIGVNPLFAIGLGSNFLDTSYNILYATSGTTGLDYAILADPDTYPSQIAAYTTFISSSAKILRDYTGSSVTDAQIELEATDIVNYEIAIAATFTVFIDSVSDVLEKVDIGYLQTATDEGVAGQFNWLTFFTTMFGETDVVIDSTEPIFIYVEPYFQAFSTLLSTTPTRTLANYFGWRYVMETSLALTYEMRDLTLAFDNALYGTTSFGDRAAHCQLQTQYDFGMQISRAYADSYFNENAKTQVEVLVELMRQAFQSLLDENTWMAADDLVVAKEKLDGILSRVAYPDWIMDNALMTLAYQGLEIVSGQHFDNLNRLGAFLNYWNLETFRDAPTVGWYMPPTVVNAYYDPRTNSITILAAIIQFPFYVDNSIAAVNYGGIGMVIGHEMTHGFDDSGRHFDKDGNVANWWSQESIDGFNERSQCFVDQYNTYSPPEFVGTARENETLNGENTLGENIADNGGIREAFRAYESYVAQFGADMTLPGFEDYSPEQLFFLGFANVWCEHKTADALATQIIVDPHSPGRFRIIGPLSNDADFWNAYSCSADSAMNRGADACVLW